jgi:1,4-alpha-glucan branching enzyme
MDADMYWHMHAESQNLVIERGVALHKMIRLISFALGGEAYLSFMGNEFGHPEWIDFPREGNNWSFQHARRQWSLADNPELRYRGLAEFDRAMQRLDMTHGILSEPLYAKLFVHEDWKLLGAHRGPLVLLFNFHPTHSPTGFRVGVPEARDYKLLLNTDNPQFDGHGLVAEDVVYPLQATGWHDRAQSIQVYRPARTAKVLGPV